jgi:ribonuclease P protein subunit RPR2
MTRRRAPKVKAKRLTQARMDILWEQAQKDVRAGKPDIARQKMLSARTIAQKTRTKMPRHISRRICKTCGTILVPGNTCRVRVRRNRSKHVVVTCLSCGAVKRYYI